MISFQFLFYIFWQFGHVIRIMSMLVLPHTVGIYYSNFCYFSISTFLINMYFKIGFSSFSIERIFSCSISIS